MRVSPINQRLTALEAEFDSLLVACLKACANGPWGLFGQNQNPEAARFLQWKEAEQLNELAKKSQASAPSLVSRILSASVSSNAVRSAGKICLANQNARRNSLKRWG